MENFDLLNILYYCIFTMFLYYQQLHLRDFHGSSKVFELVLSVSVLVGMITGLAFLVIYGVKVIWWAPFILLGISILFTMIGAFIESLLGGFTLSLVGFMALPTFAFLMFKSIPA